MHSFQKFFCSFFFFFFADFWGSLSQSPASCVHRFSHRGQFFRHDKNFWFSFCTFLAAFNRDTSLVFCQQLPVLPLCERLLSSTSTRKRCQPVFVCHPLDDQLEFFLYHAFFKPSMLISGAREKATKMEGDTLIPLLGTYGIIHFATFFKVSFLPSRIEVVVTVPSVKEQIRRPTLSSTPLISPSRFRTLSGVLGNTDISISKSTILGCTSSKQEL